MADHYRIGRIMLAGDAAMCTAPPGAGMNAEILHVGRLSAALAGDGLALNRYGFERRPVAQQVVALADRLTRLATVSPGWRMWRNLLLLALSKMPQSHCSLAMPSGLGY
ncbi:MAG: hypothetical protein EOP24_44135 [Hyphomicrobiales bacterium]|nr:MAG: hypothetical protein EOP24_44135 [Hyphomicrobiales bacterium]